MKRILMLAKYEFKTIRWTVFIMFVMLYFFGINLYSERLAEVYSVDYLFQQGAFFSTDLVAPCISVINIFLIIKLAMIQFSDKDMRFLSCMPFTKKELFMTKTAVGTAVIFIEFLFYSVCISFIYDKYQFIAYDALSISGMGQEAFDMLSKSSLIMYAGYYFLIFAAFYYFLCFMQTVVRNSSLGALFGCCAVLYPFGVIYTLGSVMDYLIGIGFRIVDTIGTVVSPFWYFMDEYFFIEERTADDTDIISRIDFNAVSVVGVKALIIFIIGVLSIGFACYLYQKEEQNGNRNMFVFKWTSGFFVAMSALGAASFAGWYVMELFDSRLFVAAAFIIFGFLGWFFSSKFVELTCGKRKLRGGGKK